MRIWLCGNLQYHSKNRIIQKVDVVAVLKPDLEITLLCYVCIEGSRNNLIPLKVVRPKHNNIEQENMNGKRELHFYRLMKREWRQELCSIILNIYCR